MNSDGSGRRPLTSGWASGYPNWSPDGGRLVMSRRDGDQDDLYWVALDGSRQHRLTHTPAVSEIQASWSPDGLMIAYAAVAPDAPDDWQKSIFVIPADGEAPPRQLTPGQFNDATPSWIVIGEKPR